MRNLKSRKDFIEYGVNKKKYEELRTYFSNIKNKKLGLTEEEIVGDVKYFAKLLKLGK